MSNEIKVGAVFLLVVVVATAVALYMGSCWSRMGTYYIYVRFADAGTVEPGADVMMSGVRIGTVAAVSLEPNEAKWPGHPAVISIAVRKEYHIPSNYQFAIAQGGLLASRYITVDPPPPPVPGEQAQASRAAKAAGPLAAGTTVVGSGFKGLAALDSLTDEARRELPGITNTLQNRMVKLTERLEATYMGPQQEKMIRQILANLSMMTATANRAALNADRLAASLSKTANEASPDMVGMVKDLRAAAQNVRGISQRMYQFTTLSPLPADLTAAGQSIKKAAGAAQQTAESVRDIVGTPEFAVRMKEMTADLTRASAGLATLTQQMAGLASDKQLQSNLKGSAADLKATMDGLRTTTAHLQKVLTNPQMSEDLQATVHNLREATAEGTVVAKKASASLDRVDRTMDRVSGAVNSLRPDRTTGHFDVFGVRDHGLQLDLDLDLYYGRKPQSFWRFGVVDIGDSERLDLQRGMPLGGPWTLRAGVFANKPGLGIDWRSSRGWRAEADLWDPDKTYLDLAIYRALSPNWMLSAGVVDAFGDKGPFLGVRHYFGVSGPAPKGASGE